MDVTNISLQTQRSRFNNPLLPTSIRRLIVGPSNCGKTILLLNLLLKEGWLDYNHLLVFGNSLFQEEYEIIKKGFENKLGKTQILHLFQNHSNYGISPLDAIEQFNSPKEGGITAEFYENCELIPDPKALDKRLKNLLILDDCYLGKQSTARAYFTRGRHSNCDVFYISQNYFSLLRNSVRENSNLIILFSQNLKSVEHIYHDHCTDIPFKEFKELCENIWSTKYNFLTIDLTSTPFNGKYRKILHHFISQNIIIVNNSSIDSVFGLVLTNHHVFY